MRLLFVTGNLEKIKEAKSILAGIEIDHQKLDLPELQGEPQEIALEKAKIACKMARKAVFVEDTSLCFNAWKGLPGPYIKHFIDKLGVDGLYKMLEPYKDKSAYAQVCIGYCEPGREPEVFVGRVDGTIVEPAGDGGFEFDKIFVPRGERRRFSQMTRDEKNKISHRRRAFEEFKKRF